MSDSFLDEIQSEGSSYPHISIDIASDSTLREIRETRQRSERSERERPERDQRARGLKELTTNGLTVLCFGSARVTSFREGGHFHACSARREPAKKLLSLNK